MTRSLLTELQQLQNLALSYLESLSEEEARRQYHSDLSPLAWHIGHMAYVDTYWIQEVVLGNKTINAWKELYLPEFTPKSLRAAKLPSKTDLTAFVVDLNANNLRLLTDLTRQGSDHPLLRNNYLHHFLLQHHDQHLETIQQILHQQALTRPWPVFIVENPCPIRAAIPANVAPRIAHASIGHSGGPDAYDNELCRHEIAMAPFFIATHSVSNAEYLGFIASNGYTDKQYWSDPGWQWLQQTQIRAPEHWRQDQVGEWFSIGIAGPTALDPQYAVSGINYYETQAFTHYARHRLPTEQEWECAAAQDIIKNIHTWEWCANALYPYPGFQSFPYAGYSTPWFDGHHYTLRGGSRHTSVRIKRPTFRNFYTADKRHIFAGVRLAVNC